MSTKKTFGIHRNRLQNMNHAKLQLHKKKNRFKYMNQDQQSITHSKQFDLQQFIQVRQTILTMTNYYLRQQEIPQAVKNHINIMLHVHKYAKRLNKCQIKLHKQKLKWHSKPNVDTPHSSKAKHKKEIKIFVNYQNKLLISYQNVKEISIQQETSVARLQCNKNVLILYYITSDYRNMQMSLAQQIRQASKNLRNQQKQYFERLRTYQNGTINNAIQLNTEDRQKMRGDQMLFQTQQKLNQNQQQNMRVNDLVKSINQLTTVYRELNELVIHQGSLIDRIDFNIQQTFAHVQKGNQHLKSADQKAHNKYAAKCIYILMTGIIILAVILAFKYSASSK